MPPSPALRFSPVRDHRRENHKRGHSLESGLRFKEKEDDLALFNEVQNREKNSFLLQSVDDFDNSISTRLASFSDLKLGISIPVRGDSSDLLNVDSEKNDYDWLLTPPGTPLFPSLDDETPSTNIVHRGRSRTQPIPISRSAKTEKSYRNRTSESPRRSSLSPRSGNDTVQSKGRPSTHRSSPTPVLRSITPSRRPFTPNKPLTPPQRSSTPTRQQMNTGGQPCLSAVSRGSSPGRATRGNSTSPKVNVWRSTFPDVSLDLPPNLRTSLLDRSASHVRGSSPASRNGTDSFPRVRRQSMSPTASRSASSLYSYDQDHFSSHSKGSVASSGDDDVDSLRSVIVGTNHPTSNKNEAFLSMAFAKKPSRFPSSSSTPKRSLNSALRQMDPHKISQNMFRPLLSSVPGTTFRVGKANTPHHRNSSVTTSSNTSSNQGAGFAPDSECGNHDHEDLAKAPHLDIHAEHLIFDKMEDGNENLQHVVGSEDPFNWQQSVNGSILSNAKIQESENLSSNCEAAVITATAGVLSPIAGEFLDVDSNKVMPSCSICGSNYILMESMNRNANICAECAKKSELLIVAQDSTSHSGASVEGNKFCEMEPVMGLHKLPKVISGQDTICPQESNVEQGLSWPCDSYLKLMLLQEDQHHKDQLSESNQHVLGHMTGSYQQSTCCTADEHLQHFSGHPNLQADRSEDADISVLLRRSSSSKWPIVQGKATTAMDVPYDDLTYGRNNSNTTKSSIGQASASSSVDLGLYRQIEAHFQRQLSSKKTNIGNSRFDADAKFPSARSSVSGISNIAHEGFVHAKNTNEETFDGSVRDNECQGLEEMPEAIVGALESTKVFDGHSPIAGAAALEEHKLAHADSCCGTDVSASESSSYTKKFLAEDDAAMGYEGDTDHVSTGNMDHLLPSNLRIVSDMEAQIKPAEPSITDEDVILDDSLCGIDGSSSPAASSSAMAAGELEDCLCNAAEQKSNYASSPGSKIIAKAFLETSISETSENNEEPTVIVGGPTGQKSRSLTLEEATDTILFCSSIIHNLAYEAASIAIEKEKLIPLEGSGPTVAIFGKSDSNRNSQHGRTHTPKPQKVRQKRMQTDVKTPSLKTENDENIQQPLPDDSAPPKKVDSMRPPKLESKCNCTVM